MNKDFAAHDCRGQGRECTYDLAVSPSSILGIHERIHLACYVEPPFLSEDVILMRHILPAAHFAGRCSISAKACNRFESTAFLVIRALSFSDRAML